MDNWRDLCAMICKDSEIASLSPVDVSFKFYKSLNDLYKNESSYRANMNPDEKMRCCFVELNRMLAPVLCFLEKYQNRFENGKKSIQGMPIVSLNTNNISVAINSANDFSFIRLIPRNKFADSDGNIFDRRERYIGTFSVYRAEHVINFFITIL